MCNLNIGLMKCGRVKWQEVEETRKYFNDVLIHQDKNFFYLQALQGHSNNFFEYIYHIGCAINLHSIINSGLIPGGQNLSKTQTVFCPSVDLMSKEHRDLDVIDLDALRLALFKQKVWREHQNTVYWVDIKLAQKKGFKFFQT